MKPVSVDRERCVVCGLCVEVCGRDGLRIENDRIELGGFRCMECGHCVALCPNGALATEQGVPSDIRADLAPSPEMIENMLRARRSHRAYEKRDVEREVVERMLDLARYSPSGKNEQPFEFVVLHSPESRKAFTEASVGCMRQAQRKLHNRLWRFVVGLLIDKRVRDSKLRRSVDRAIRRCDAGMDPLFFGAPLIVFVHGPAVGSTPKDDCVYALNHMLLLGESLGLGACVNGNSEALIRHFPELRAKLGIADDRRVYACATFGYPRIKYLRYVHRKPPRATFL